MKYTFCYLMDGLPSHLGNHIPCEIVDISWKMCRNLARIKTNRFSEWAIQRSSDNVIVAQSKGYKS